MSFKWTYSLDKRPKRQGRCLGAFESPVLHLVTAGLGNDTPLAIVLSVTANPYECGYPFVPSNVRIETHGASEKRHKYILSNLPLELQPADVSIFSEGVPREDWAVLSTRLQLEIEDVAFSPPGGLRRMRTREQLGPPVPSYVPQKRLQQLLPQDVDVKAGIMNCLGRFIDISRPAPGKRLIFEASENLLDTTLDIKTHIMSHNDVGLRRVLNKNFEAIRESLRTTAPEHLKTIHVSERFFDACTFCVKSTKSRCVQCRAFEALLEWHLDEISKGYAVRRRGEQVWNSRGGLPPWLY